MHIARLRDSFLTRARIDGLDDLDQAVERCHAKGGEPCRDALRAARPGEPLILASYSPFSVKGPYREFGPIFILAEPEPDAVDRTVLPTPYFKTRFALRAYSRDERIIDARLTPLAEAAHHIGMLLALPDTAFLHARFGAYGCFGCAIDPAARVPC